MKPGMHVPFAALGLTAVILLTAAYIVYQLYFSPIAKFPGPFAASISRLWLVRHARNGDMHRQMISLHARYGEVVRTGPNEISVSDLDAVNKIYGSWSIRLGNNSLADEL